ncbi:hypothetical protein CFP56_005231 [Quercus suber]|uniref:Uncharacterized protein n=1 Tax=Quercus suber TaxID=58331 RepID=A0AAW0LBZ0_QUESU
MRKCLLGGAGGSQQNNALSNRKGIFGIKDLSQAKRKLGCRNTFFNTGAGFLIDLRQKQKGKSHSLLSSSPSGFSRHALSILVTHNQHKYLFFYRHSRLPRLRYRVPIATFLITLVTFSISYPAYIISINKIICELF